MLVSEIVVMLVSKVNIMHVGVIMPAMVVSQRTMGRGWLASAGRAVDDSMRSAPQRGLWRAPPLLQ
jgi:hypothetical protein